MGLQVVCATKVLNSHINLKASLMHFCAVVVFLGQLLLVCLVYESQMQDIICAQKKYLIETSKFLNIPNVSIHPLKITMIDVYFLIELYLVFLPICAGKPAR